MGEVSLPLFERGYLAMRQDARFVRLCGRLGLCDYWLDSGHWPDCADELAPYYDFKSAARAFRSEFGPIGEFQSDLSACA